MEEYKGVIPFKHFPLAPEDTPWNGPREVREAEVSDLKIMCAWYDSENPDIKASYKLPHHRAKDHYTVWNGVRAAMAALFGARGGVRIPSKDRKGVYNHLSRHYKEFDKEPPEFREYSDVELKEMFPEVYEMSDEEWKAVVGEITEEEKAFDIEAKLDQIAEAILRVEEKLVVLSEKFFEKVEVKQKDEGPADENPETSGEEIDPGEVREIAETVIDRVIRRITGRDV